mgnify:FL=1
MQEKIQRKFFMGNGITTTDKAAKDLLGRDLKKLLQLLLNYRKGQLGAYFVPPIFISQVPEVVVLDYDAYNEKSENKGKHKGGLKGQIAERIMFLELQQYFEKTGDEVIAGVYLLIG